MRTLNDIKTIVYNKAYTNERITASFLALTGKEKIAYADEEELSGILTELKNTGVVSKEVIVLKRFQGRLFQRCPGSKGMICCNYSLLNTCFGCLYDCAYCFLNSYINFYGIVQFTHIDDLDVDIPSGDTGIIYRVGTGEFTDSLMMDEATGIAPMLIDKLADRRDIMLELKTKSANIDHLLGIPKRGNTVLAWSLNTDHAAALYEAGGATLEARLAAARKALDAGYFLAFHFDPIIRYEGAVAEYESLVHRLFSVIDPNRVVWISLGCFRCPVGFQDSMNLTTQEMFPGLDGKMRYLRNFRLDIYRRMNKIIASYSHKPFVYLCMESADMWSDVFDADYSNSDELELAMSLHLKKEFLL